MHWPLELPTVRLCCNLSRAYAQAAAACPNGKMTNAWKPCSYSRHSASTPAALTASKSSMPSSRSSSAPPTTPVSGGTPVRVRVRVRIGVRVRVTVRVTVTVRVRG